MRWRLTDGVFEGLMTAHPRPSAATTLTVKEPKRGFISLVLSGLAIPHKGVYIAVQGHLGVPKQVVQAGNCGHTTRLTQPPIRGERGIRAGSLSDLKPNVLNILRLPAHLQQKTPPVGVGRKTCLRFSTGTSALAEDWEVGGTTTVASGSAECHSLMCCCQVLTNAVWIM